MREISWDCYLAFGPYQKIYHMCEITLLEKAMNSPEKVYYPPTYQVDGFIHATEDPKLLVDVANHFYKSSKDSWVCLELSIPWLLAQGNTQVIYEAAAPVGDIEAVESDNNLKFPHIYGGISKNSITRVFNIVRDDDGTFIRIENL